MKKNKSIINKKFGRWTVLKFSEEYEKRHPRVDCICDCGVVRSVLTHSVVHGISKSCGCFRKEIDKIKRKTHGMYKSKEYVAWIAMKSRCNTKSAKGYDDYGGRGIKVCKRWENSFQNFFEDMGTKPTEKHSLDRINVNGDYEPSNCRWATQSEQNKNRRQKDGKIKGIKVLPTGVFEVTINFFGKNKYVGRFKDLDKAVSAYNARKKELEI